MYWKMRNEYTVLVGRIERGIQLGESSQRWAANINIDLKLTRFHDGD
jgi:hypothetical protein